MHFSSVLITFQMCLSRPASKCSTRVVYWKDLQPATTLRGFSTCKILSNNSHRAAAAQVFLLYSQRSKKVMNRWINSAVRAVSETQAELIKGRLLQFSVDLIWSWNSSSRLYKSVWCKQSCCALPKMSWAALLLQNGQSCYFMQASGIKFRYEPIPWPAIRMWVRHILLWNIWRRILMKMWSYFGLWDNTIVFIVYKAWMKCI